MQPDVSLAAEAAQRFTLNNSCLAQSHPSENITMCCTWTKPHSDVDATQLYLPSSNAQLRQAYDRLNTRDCQLTSTDHPNQITCIAPGLVPYGPVTLTMMALLQCRGHAITTSSNKNTVTDPIPSIDCNTWHIEKSEMSAAVTGSPFRATQPALSTCCSTSTGPGLSAVSTMAPVQTQTADHWVMQHPQMNKIQHSQQDYFPYMYAAVHSDHPERPPITAAVKTAGRDANPPPLDAVTTHSPLKAAPRDPEIPASVPAAITVPYAARHIVTTGSSVDGTKVEPCRGVAAPPEALDVFAAAPVAPCSASDAVALGAQQRGEGGGVAGAPDGPFAVQGDPPAALLPEAVDAMVVEELPRPVLVQVASRGRRTGSRAAASERITRGTVGLFHPRLYLSGGDCIECGNEMMSRGKFERLAGTATAKWHVSIKVLPSGMTLGRWLQKHGLPVLQGRPRKRKAAECDGDCRVDAEEDSTEDDDDDDDDADAHLSIAHPKSVTDCSPPPQLLRMTLQPPRVIQASQSCKGPQLCQEPHQMPQPAPSPRPTQTTPLLRPGVGRATRMDEHSAPADSHAPNSSTHPAAGTPLDVIAAAAVLETSDGGDLSHFAAATPPGTMPDTSKPFMSYVPYAPAPAVRNDLVVQEGTDTPVMELLESLGILEEIYDTSDGPVDPSYNHTAAPTAATRAGTELISSPNSPPGILSLSTPIASLPLSSWLMQPEGLGNNTPSGGGGGGGEDDGDGDDAANAGTAERRKDFLEWAYSSRWSVSGEGGDRKVPPVDAAARCVPMCRSAQWGVRDGNGGGCSGGSCCGGVDNGRFQHSSRTPSQTPSRGGSESGLAPDIPALSEAPTTAVAAAAQAPTLAALCPSGGACPWRGLSIRRIGMVAEGAVGMLSGVRESCVSSSRTSGPGVATAAGSEVNNAISVGGGMSAAMAAVADAVTDASGVGWLRDSLTAPTPADGGTCDGGPATAAGVNSVVPCSPSSASRHRIAGGDLWDRGSESPYGSGTCRRSNGTLSDGDTLHKRLSDLTGVSKLPGAPSPFPLPVAAERPLAPSPFLRCTLPYHRTEVERNGVGVAGGLGVATAWDIASVSCVGSSQATNLETLSSGLQSCPELQELPSQLKPQQLTAKEQRMQECCLREGQHVLQQQQIGPQTCSHLHQQVPSIHSQRHRKDPRQPLLPPPLPPPLQQQKQQYHDRDWCDRVQVGVSGAASGFFPSTPITESEKVSSLAASRHAGGHGGATVPPLELQHQPPPLQSSYVWPRHQRYHLPNAHTQPLPPQLVQQQPWRQYRPLPAMYQHRRPHAAYRMHPYLRPYDSHTRHGVLQVDARQYHVRHREAETTRAEQAHLQQHQQHWMLMVRQQNQHARAYSVSRATTRPYGIPSGALCPPKLTS